MERRREREKLIEKLDINIRRGWPYCEYIIDYYLHIKYDEIDLRDELMTWFRCREVVDYLLTILDGETIRRFIMAMSKHPVLYPMFGLVSFCQDSPEVLDNIYRIYSDNSMDNYAEASILAREQSRRPFTLSRGDNNEHIEETREGEKEYFLNRINTSNGLDWPHTEDILERYLHIAYDEFDLSEELLRKFECRAVVDYLLTFMDRDTVKTVLVLSTTLLNHLHPLLVLRDYCSAIRESRYEILNNISRIYHENSMEEFATMAKMFSEMCRGSR